MAATSKPTGTPSHKIYVKLANTANVDSISEVEGLGGLNDCITFGPIVQTGNPSEWTPQGSSVTKSIAGAASLGEFPIRFVITESNALHSSLLNAKVGAAIEAGLVKVEGSNKTAYYAYGEIASKEISFETPSEASISIALRAEPGRYNT